MIVYASNITIRLQYIVQTIYGDACVITNDINTFKNSVASRINYSDQRITENELWIKPYGLLSEEGIKLQNTTCFKWKGLAVFFKTDGDIPFDYFAAAFYLLTRYEEYLPHIKDRYGRYAHTNSLAFQQGFLTQPLIHLWMKEIHAESSFTTDISSFSFLPTYDVDIAFAYTHQSVFGNVLSIFKNIVTGKWKKLHTQIQMLSNKAKDPYDVFDWLNVLTVQYHLKPLWFFLVAQKRQGYDKNISALTKGMQALIQQTEKSSIGIHPSFQSNTDKTIVFDEIKKLEQISSVKINASRQHYLIINTPVTFRNLIEAGITNDYSMGYGTSNGFRASYTLPYKWYDVQKNEITALTIHPFCFMDATAIFQQKQSAEETLKELLYYYKTIKEVSGCFITIFHNHFLSMEEEWSDWRKMYDTFLKQVSNS